MLILIHSFLNLLLELFNILKVITRGGSNTGGSNGGPSTQPGGNKPNGPSGGGGPKNNTNIFSWKKRKEKGKDNENIQNQRKERKL